MFKVIDLSRLLPGPYATFCLQGLGMEVTKVEEPGTGDYLRHYEPMHEGTGLWFSAINRGKKSVTLNLKRPDDRAALRRLLRDADVLVESFRPGVLKRLGLDPLELREEFPRLVIASITGWGQSGPMAQLPGHDIGFMCLAGMLSGDPRIPKIQWADLASGGLAAALRITGALLARQQTGQGCWLDIAMLDGLVGLQPTRFANLVAGAPPDEVLTGGLPQYNLYRCADGAWISVGALEGQFLALLEAEVGDIHAESLTTFFGSAPRDHWLERLGGACVVPLLELSEVPGNPQVLSRQLFNDQGFVHPPTGPVEGQAPSLGQHNAELLGATDGKSH
jgi:alpha-methylacyl-CoA racemase